VGVTLCASTPRLFYIPPGFAHGFCVLSETADFVYKVTAEYAPALERGIQWDDPAIGVQWPMADPILSARDMKQPPLSQADL
jgi:dTDP-4-dehydrorhamnose 3,5-epimerase